MSLCLEATFIVSCYRKVGHDFRTLVSLKEELVKYQTIHQQHKQTP